MWGKSAPPGSWRALQLRNHCLGRIRMGHGDRGAGAAPVNKVAATSATSSAAAPARTELHRMGDKECKNRVAREQAHACWRCGVPRERQRDRFEPSSIAGKAQRKKPCAFPLNPILS